MARYNPADHGPPDSMSKLHKAAEAVRSAGRGGDTVLAHINPREAALLKAHGGSGTINPKTGLLEFDDDPLMSFLLAQSDTIANQSVAQNVAALSDPGNAQMIQYLDPGTQSDLQKYVADQAVALKEQTAGRGINYITPSASNFSSTDQSVTADTSGEAPAEQTSGEAPAGSSSSQMATVPTGGSDTSSGIGDVLGNLFGVGSAQAAEVQQPQPAYPAPGIGAADLGAPIEVPTLNVIGSPVGTTYYPSVDPTGGATLTLPTPKVAETTATDLPSWTSPGVVIDPYTGTVQGYNTAQNTAPLNATDVANQNAAINQMLNYSGGTLIGQSPLSALGQAGQMDTINRLLDYSGGTLIGQNPPEKTPDEIFRDNNPFVGGKTQQEIDAEAARRTFDLPASTGTAPSNVGAPPTTIDPYTGKSNLIGVGEGQPDAYGKLAPFISRQVTDAAPAEDAALPPATAQNPVAAEPTVSAPRVSTPTPGADGSIGIVDPEALLLDIKKKTAPIENGVLPPATAQNPVVARPSISIPSASPTIGSGVVGGTGIAPSIGAEASISTVDPEAILKKAAAVEDETLPPTTVMGKSPDMTSRIDAIVAGQKGMQTFQTPLNTNLDTKPVDIPYVDYNVGAKTAATPLTKAAADIAARDAILRKYLGAGSNLYSYGKGPERTYYGPAAAKGGYFDADQYFADGGLVQPLSPPTTPVVSAQPTMAFTDGAGLVGSIAQAPGMLPSDSIGSDAPHASPMAPSVAAAVPSMQPGLATLAMPNVNASPSPSPIAQNPNVGYALGNSPLSNLSGS